MVPIQHHLRREGVCTWHEDAWQLQVWAKSFQPLVLWVEWERITVNIPHTKLWDINSTEAANGRVHSSCRRNLNRSIRSHYCTLAHMSQLEARVFPCFHSCIASAIVFCWMNITWSSFQWLSSTQLNYLQEGVTLFLLLPQDSWTCGCHRSCKWYGSLSTAFGCPRRQKDRTRQIACQLFCFVLFFRLLLLSFCVMCLVCRRLSRCCCSCSVLCLVLCLFTCSFVCPFFLVWLLVHLGFVFVLHFCSLSVCHILLFGFSLSFVFVSCPI